MQSMAREYGLDIVTLLESQSTAAIRARGHQRLLESIVSSAGIDHSSSIDLYTSEGRMIEIFSYLYALMVVCASADKALGRRWAHGEAMRAKALIESDPHMLEQVALTYLGDVNLDPENISIGLLDWLELSPRISGDNWRLIHQDLEDGRVMLGGGIQGQKRVARLLLERVRDAITESIEERSSRLDDETASHLAESVAIFESELRLNHSSEVELTEVNEGDLPPCMQVIISELSEGVNVNHTGRLFLASMAHTNGWTIEQTKSLFQKAPDYDAGTTTYQLGQIYETKYTPAGCPKMKVNRNCPVQLGDNSLCDQSWMTHPLKYLKARQRDRRRDAPLEAAGVPSKDTTLPEGAIDNE